MKDYVSTLFKYQVGHQKKSAGFIFFISKVLRMLFQKNGGHDLGDHNI